MNASEANAVNNVLRWVTGQNGDPAKARTEAMWLADRAHDRLGAGLTPDDVARHWPGGQPRGDLAFVADAIEAWESGGIAPHDVLVAIRDQLAGHVPGVTDG